MIGTTALRVVQNGKAVYFEKFDLANGWNKILPSELRRSFSDKQFREWIGKHKNLTNAKKSDK